MRNFSYNSSLTALMVLVSFAGTFAQEHAMHSGDSENLGSIHFATSCSAQVQTDFDTGVALLHSFEYARATERFREVEKRDPACAMGYWGEAMSLYHQLWDPPSEKDLAVGGELAKKARAAKESSPRELEYIQAVTILYKPEKQSVEERAMAYSKAMEKLHADNPSDEEATVFYALSLLAAEPPSDTSLEYPKKAVALLNAVLANDPNHPGVAHYLIHACDNPKMAQEGLPAAKRYAGIASSSAHALHMPSHIFARLGYWQDDINSNLAAVAATQHGSWGAEYRLHPMDFLEYAYLQTGQDDKAREIEAQGVAVKSEDFTIGRGQYYFYVQAQFPSLLALETRDWKTAAALQPAPNGEPGFHAMTYWAQAIGAARSDDVPAAREAVRKLDQAEEAAHKKNPDYPLPPVDTKKNEAHAWQAFAEKDSAKAFDLMKPVIEYQDQVGKGEVELPAREMYADMLLELNRPSEALEQYQMSLKSDPNRFNGLYGAGRAAELSHQNSLAATYYKQLLDNCNHGTTSARAELLHAKEFVTEAASATAP